jgi:hypothetical protein
MLVLFRFDCASLEGFHGGTVSKAELRLFTNSGNTLGTVGRVLSSWSEGNKNNDYPGKAPPTPGASMKHPHGMNTDINQDEYGQSVPSGTPGSWKSGDFSATNGHGSDTGVGLDGDMARGHKEKSTYCLVYDVTDIVQTWASKEVENDGLWMANGNYVINFKEAGSDAQPVLFISYTPKVPAGTVIQLR